MLAICSRADADKMGREQHVEAMTIANENAHPNKAGKDSRKGNRGQPRGPLDPTPSVSANFRSGLYVDSCDAAELDLRRKPISEVNESAGALQRARPSQAYSIAQQTLLSFYAGLRT